MGLLGRWCGDMRACVKRAAVHALAAYKCGGKVSAGRMKVVEFGPKLEKKKVSP